MAESATQIKDLKKDDKLKLHRASEDVKVDFKSMPNFFPFEVDSYGDARDITAFVGIQTQVLTKPYETKYGRNLLNKNTDLWVVAYRQKVDIDGNELEFGRFNVNHHRHKIFGGGNTNLDFRRLGDEYILKVTDTARPGELYLRGKIAEIPATASNAGYEGMLHNVVGSMDDGDAKDFLIDPLNRILKSLK